MIKLIKTSRAPKAIGPYSQAVISKPFVFCSGQIGLNPQTGTLVEGIEKQTDQVLKNLNYVLKKSGSSLDKVLKTTVYLKDIAHFAKMNEVYAKYFKGHKPARSTVEVSNLPKEALIEIDVVANV